ncbi:MAG: putative GTPase [Phycisphaerales bacterium]|nr:putative GTPase [Phycisphaerales bacterium]
MTPAVEQLVRDTMDLTGADAPDLLRADAPVLDEAVIADAALSDVALAPGDASLGGVLDAAAGVGPAPGDDFYLVGIIGGKDVGKSALVNAIVGRDITAITSHGPGTEIAIAYVHATREAALRALLDREVPGKFRVVVHDSPDLARQVLLDLPDIDSTFQSHLAVTRQMLRHMLFPVWAQSIEKYADGVPQQMLAQVAAGNDARNFLFCLTKADQLDANGGMEAGEELRQDYAQRIVRTTGLKTPPPVFLVSSRRPSQYDLPKLAAQLGVQKTTAIVRQSKALAARRQDTSLLDWITRQDLAGRAERLGRLRQEAEEAVAQRVAVPLVDRVLPRIAEDPNNRLALADEILADRVGRWPLVTLVHTLMAPLMLMLRAMASKNPAALLSGDALVDQHLRSQAFPLGPAVQSAFAQLRQAHPLVGEMYKTRRLWEEPEADLVAVDLGRRLSAAVDRQRDVARDRLSPAGGWLAPGRWLLTIGALLWFPIVQPVLEAVLSRGVEQTRWDQMLGLIVAVLGVNYLTKSVGFLAIWFVVLWLGLRWNTQRRVARLLGRWRAADDLDPDLNLGTQALAWAEELTAPIAAAHERMATLAGRAEGLREQLGKAA